MDITHARTFLNFHKVSVIQTNDKAIAFNKIYLQDQVDSKKLPEVRDLSSYE